MQNNITYDNHGFAVPDKDNNGRIIENTNFFFDMDYLLREFDQTKQQLLNVFSDTSDVNNIDQTTITMVGECLYTFMCRGIQLKSFVALIKSKNIGNYPMQSFPDREINIYDFAEVLNSTPKDLKIPESVPTITFQQFVNYLINKIYFLGIQCMYNIMDILNDNDMLQKDNKIKKEIALCYDNIMNIMNMLKYQLLPKLSIKTYSRYHDEDLIDSINPLLDDIVTVRMHKINERYNLSSYRNMDI